MHKIYLYIYWDINSEVSRIRTESQLQMLSWAMQWEKSFAKPVEKGKAKENLFGWWVKLWWGWGYAPSCLDKINVGLILYYFWCFSVCIYDDLALYYASGSSKNDVTMMEQVSIVKRAKFIVRTKWTIPKHSIKLMIMCFFVCEALHFNFWSGVIIVLYIIN